MPDTPTVQGQNIFQQLGYTYLWWGTEPVGNGLASDDDNFYIVLSAQSNQVSETINIPGAWGQTIASINVVDGIHWLFTVIEDTTITPPTVGSIVSLENVYLDESGNVLPMGADIVLPGNFKVENSDFNADARQYGRRIISCQSYCAIPQIDGSGNPQNNGNYLTNGTGPSP